MDEGVYVRVFPWRSSEARLSWAADGDPQRAGRENGDGRRERDKGDRSAASPLPNKDPEPTLPCVK